MDVSWPSALRTVGAYCLGSLFAGTRSQDKSTDTDSLVVPRENAWRKVARCARPLVLTIAAGVAFGAILRFHNPKFKDGMVRSFQRRQPDTTRSLAGSVEESVANIRSSLVLGFQSMTINSMSLSHWRCNMQLLKRVIHWSPGTLWPPVRALAVLLVDDNLVNRQDYMETLYGRT